MQRACVSCGGGSCNITGHDRANYALLQGVLPAVAPYCPVWRLGEDLRHCRVSWIDQGLGALGCSPVYVPVCFLQQQR